MRRIVMLIAAAAVCLLPCANRAAEETVPRVATHTAPSKADGLFIHLSHGSDDSHRALMALNLAAMMAEAERPVLVYCDIKAVEMLVKDAKDVEHDAFPSSNAQIERLVKAGALVRACPGCMKAAGLDPEQLKEGVKLADADEFFSFTEGRILSLDY